VSQLQGKTSYPHCCEVPGVIADQFKALRDEGKLCGRVILETLWNGWVRIECECPDDKAAAFWLALYDFRLCA
jgi:hypothetical protein